LMSFSRHGNTLTDLLIIIVTNRELFRSNDGRRILTLGIRSKKICGIVITLVSGLLD